MKKPKSDKKPFDFEAFREEAMARLTAGDRIGGPDGIMAPLMQEFIQASLEGEMEAHLEEGPQSNRRNGKGKKRVRWTDTKNTELQASTHYRKPAITTRRRPGLSPEY